MARPPQRPPAQSSQGIARHLKIRERTVADDGGPDRLEFRCGPIVMRRLAKPGLRVTQREPSGQER